MGHRHEHRFPVERLQILKDEDRKHWLPPEPTLRAAGVHTGAIVVDVGAGTGFWTLPLSRLVGETGTVYAVDVEPVMLDELGAMVSVHRLTNVKVLQSEELRIPLPSGIADWGVAGFVLHEPSDPGEFLRECVRLLRPAGSILVVDWHKEKMEKGPPLAPRLSQSEAEVLLESAGLGVERLPAPNTDVYVLLGLRRFQETDLKSSL